MSANKNSRDPTRTSRRRSPRSESHRESHARAGPRRPDPIPPHPRAGGEPEEIVRTASAMAKMVRHLKAAGQFAFDSEFIGERSYEPLLCLVQAATERKVFLVDPLAGLDMSPFWDLLTCPTVRKLVLAGQQDFLPAVRHTGRPPANVVDVQIAAGFVHDDYPLSLVKLVAEFTGVPLAGSMGFSHWDNRPLSAVQVRYAGDDVRYLPAAFAAIEVRLTELGHMDWALQECAAVLEDVALYVPPPRTMYLRVRGRDRLDRRRLAVLRELAIVRDKAARRENVPTRTLLRDSILVSMARRPPRELADLDAVRGLPRPVEARYGPQIIRAAAKALALPADKLPPPEAVEGSRFRPYVDKVWAGISEFCLARSIAPGVVASRKEVFRYCYAVHHGKSVAEHRLARGWRAELLGDLLARLVGERG